MEMAALVEQFRKAFWSEKFWLPNNVSWKDIEATKSAKFVQAGELYLALPVAVLLIVIRVIFERFIARPLVQYIGVKDKKRTIEANPFCEKVYQTISRNPDKERIEGLSKQLSWSTQQVKRWFRYRRNQSKPSLLRKGTETLWRFTFYTSAVGYGFYILKDRDFFWDIKRCFVGYPKEHIMSDDLYYYYIVELGFYISLTISQFVDVQRKDFWQMLIHHWVTILLISFSYEAGFHRIGAIIIVVHDISDVFLEAAKVTNYAKLQRMCDTFFVGFGGTFILCRLVYFPFWILHSVMISPTIVGPYQSWYCFAGLLLMLQFLCETILKYYMIWFSIRPLLVQSYSPRVEPGATTKAFTFQNEKVNVDGHSFIVNHNLYWEVLHIFWGCMIIRMAWILIFCGKVSGDTRSDTEEETSEEEEERPGEKSHQNGVANDFKKKQ